MSNSEVPSLADVCVIIPTYNGDRFIADQVASVLNDDPSSEIDLLLVDNGSSDETVKVISGLVDRYPTVRVISADHRRGKSYALNAGISETDRAKVLFLDQDDRIAPGYLHAMARALDHHEFVCGWVDIENGRFNHEDMVCAIGRLTDCNQAVIRLSRFDDIRLCQSPRKVRGEIEIPVGNGCVLGVRHYVIRQVGGFSSDVGVCEESDLCLRLWMAGIVVQRVRSAILHYRLRDSALDLIKQRFWYGFGWVAFYKKYRHCGLKRYGVRQSMSEWMKIVFLVISRDKPTRLLGLARLGLAAGRLYGSIKMSTFYP